MTALDAETFGALTGIGGAFLIASMSQYSRYGWLLFLCSNICWVVFAAQKRFHKLLLQQLAFTSTTLLGILNSFFPGTALAVYFQQLLLRISS